MEDLEKKTRSLSLGQDGSQSRSPFFERLPPEIRHQIYDAVLDSAGLTQHIYKSDVGHSAAVAHTRCCIDPDDKDMRERLVEAAVSALSNGQSIHDDTLWRARQYTDWCNHWQCEESLEAQPPYSPFLAPLLTCKRMHHEFIPLMYSRLTFSFVNTPALSRFLATTSSSCLALIRSVHLIWCASLGTASPDQASSDTDDDDDGPPDNRNGRDLDSLEMWRSIWSQLASATPRLTHVRIWIYGRFARFPMPADSYFDVLDEFASNSTGGAELAAPRVMDRFTVQVVWTREFDGFTADGRRMHEDDGETVPDWLRGRTFEVSRVPFAQYEPEAWMGMWAPPEANGPWLMPIRRGKGWGTRMGYSDAVVGRRVFGGGG